MSGLPSGQFLDYLVIGIFATAAVTVFGALLHGAIKNRISKVVAILSIPVLVALAVFGHIAVRKLVPPEPPAHVLIDPSLNPFATPTATPASTPAAAALAMPSSTAEPPIARGSSVRSFMSENIAPLGKASRRSGQWAVVITEPGSKESYPRLANAVSSVIRGAGYSTVAIFRPSAAHGTGFNTLFAVDPALSRRLNEYCDEILLGKITSSVKENPDYPGLLSLTVTVDVRIISTSSGNLVHQFQASAVGAGYSLQEARTNAEENLATNLGSEFRKAIRSE